MINLDSSLEEIPRIKKTTVKRLEKIGLKTVRDLIFYWPFRYDDYSKIMTIKELKGQKSGTVRVKINLIANHRSPRKKITITEAIVTDDTDSIKVVWFNQPFLNKVLRSGQEVYLAGKIDQDDYYGTQFLNPSYEICQQNNPIHTGRLVPIYSTTTNLTQKQLRYLVKQNLHLAQHIEDWLPRSTRSQYNLTGISFALEQIHFPQDRKWLERATHRLKFDELFLIQLRNQIIRQKIKSKIASIIKFREKETKKFVKNLSFQLTEAQRKSSWEIVNNLEKATPMNRLLEGDVGSGKTVVATVAILNVLLNKQQVAYMAPTEILAEQHFKTISEFFSKNSFKIALLTREHICTNQDKKISKNQLFKQIKEGQIGLIIGTHSLIQEKVEFLNLALAIIDEQHRFGIKQREILIEKANPDKIANFSPHFLSMTATPIPRSMALTLYGDLDLSIIDELPAGRKEIVTKIIPSSGIEGVYEFVRQKIKEGRQVFVICPLIDISDKLGVRSVKEEYKHLSKDVFPEFKTEMLHGKLKAGNKEKIMRKFAQNKINILISTTVVEVGIDIPNACVMVIQGSERFGLAQLYQLRGRIGRNEHQSHCFLVSETESDKAKKRLKALKTAKNGFELAELDLQMRGPGEIFGTHQSGFVNELKIAKLSDAIIIKEAQTTAKQLFEKDPELKECPILKQRVEEFTKTMHLE